MSLSFRTVHIVYGQIDVIGQEYAQMPPAGADWGRIGEASGAPILQKEKDFTNGANLKCTHCIIWGASNLVGVLFPFISHHIHFILSRHL